MFLKASSRVLVTVAVFAGICLVACGGKQSEGPSYDVSVDGTIHDAKYVVRQVSGSSTLLTRDFPDNPNGYDTTVALIVFGETRIDACGSPESGQGVIQAAAHQTMLQLQLASKGAVIAPGTFRFSSATSRDGEFDARLDQLVTCTATDATEPDRATAGSVTITTATDTEISGELDLTFPSGNVRGTFTSPLCTRHWVAPNVTC